MRETWKLIFVALLAACGAVKPVPVGFQAAVGDATPKITVLRHGEAPGADGFYLIPASGPANPLRRRVLDWEPSAFHRERLYGQLTRLAVGGCTLEPARPPVGTPEKLVRLERLHGRYVVYDPCDGAQPRLVFLDGFIEFLGGIGDPALMVVRQVKQSPEAGITLTVTRPFWECAEVGATVRLEPLATDGWYRVHLALFSDEESAVWITPSAAAGLDVLVNVCNEAKAREYPFERER